MGLKFKQGDWVKGSSSQGELIHGYVETIDLHQRFINVKVIACDNKKMIGRTISLLNHTVERLPDSELNHEGDLFNLIDLALSTRDKKWFYDLANKLYGKNSHDDHNDTSNMYFLGQHNRYRSNHG